MKVNKEQAAFIVALLAVGGLVVSAMSGETAPAASGSKKPRVSLNAVGDDAVEVLSDALIAPTEISWSRDGRNVFSAPSEEEPLPPLSLPVPPRPALPIAPPQPFPGLDPWHRIAFTKPLVVATDVELAPRAAAADEEPAEAEPTEDETADEGGDAESDPDKAKAEQEKVDRRVLGARERLKKSLQERVDAEKKKAEAQAKEADRKRALDKIHWMNGDVAYGQIVNDSELPQGATGLDRYEIALRIAKLRTDANLNAAALQEALASKDLEIHFRRDTDGKLGSRQTYSASAVSNVEFGDDAINKFELARRAMPLDNVGGQVDAAKELFAVKEFGRAARHMQRLIAAGKADRSVYVLLADAAREAADYDTELRAVREGLAKYPDDADLVAAQGVIYSRFGLDRLAVECFKRALDIAPRSLRVNAHYCRHVIAGGFDRRGASALAVDLAQRAAAARIDSASEKRAVMTEKAVAMLGNGQVDEASRIFKEVVEADPEAIDALNGSGAAALILGRIAEAKTAFTAVAAKNPLDGRAVYNLGLCALAERDWETARDRFFDAMDLDPLLTAEAQRALGYLYESIGQSLQAAGAYDAALVAEPDDPETMAMVGRAALNGGDYSRAQEMFEAALARMPDVYDVLAGLADSTFYLQRYGDSLRYAEAALSLAGKSVPTLIRRGQILAKLGRNDEAKKCFDEAKQVAVSDELDLSQAWFYYSNENNPEEALRRFQVVASEVEKKKIDSPLADYAKRYAAEIEDNLLMSTWTEDFNRILSGKEFGRGWTAYAPGTGIQTSISKNRGAFTGTQKQSDVPSCLYLERNGNEVVAFEARLFARAQDDYAAGLALLRFQKRSGTGPDPNPFIGKVSNAPAYEGIVFGRTPEGRLAWRQIVKNEINRWQVIDGAAWPVDEASEPVGIELGIRVIDAKKGLYALTADGRVVVNEIEMKGLQRASQSIELWVFTQAEIDKKIDLRVDDVRVVRRKAKK